MFKFLLKLSLITPLSMHVFANDILGDWKIIDDRSSNVLVKVRVTQTSDQTYQARVIEAYPAHHQTEEEMMQYRNFLVVSELKSTPNKPNQFYDGVAVDPVSKTVHKNVTAHLNARGNVLIFRGKADEEIASRRLSWVKVK